MYYDGVKSTFYERFKELCVMMGVSVSRAATDIGLSNSTPTKWKKTGALPDSTTLSKISSYFQVPFDYLVGQPEDGVSLNYILEAIAETYGISLEDALRIDQVLQSPEWRLKCKGLGLKDSFDLYLRDQKEKAPTPKDERPITFDDFTYAMFEEGKELTEENKQKLLEMAKFFRQQQEKDKQK